MSWEELGDRSFEFDSDPLYKSHDPDAPTRNFNHREMPSNDHSKFHLLDEENDTADAVVGVGYHTLHDHRAIVPLQTRQLPYYEFFARFIGAGLSST